MVVGVANDVGAAVLAQHGGVTLRRDLLTDGQSLLLALLLERVVLGPLLLKLLLEDGNRLLRVLELGLVVFHLDVFGLLLVFVLLDLGFGATALAALLKKMGTHSIGGCSHGKDQAT